VRSGCVSTRRSAHARLEVSPCICSGYDLCHSG